MTVPQLAVSATFLLFAAVPGAAVAQDCRYEARRDATIAATSGETLAVLARSGLLRIEGRPGLEEVRIRGTACASSEELLEQLRMETSRGGGTVRIEVAEVDHGWGIGRRYARLDLVIEVPAGMPAEVEDGSGDIEIRGLGSLRIDDGSGDIEVTDIEGDVTIDDGSGEVVLADIRGDVFVDDGSGEIHVRSVTGSVEIEDGSGSIRVAGVGGSVRIPDDGTGEIDVRDVRGDFIVGDKGTGSVRHANIDGRVDVPERVRRRD